MNIKASLAELIGTFGFCFVGAGSIIIDAHTGGSLGLPGIALAHGLALFAVVSATLNVSGGQINPAITVGLVLNGKESPQQGVANIVGQLIGAAAAGFLLKATFPDALTTNVGVPAMAAGVTTGNGLTLEIVGTFLLALAVYGTAVGSKATKSIAGLGIGLTVTALNLALGPLTGAAFNPARHFGSALAAGAFDNIWIYWVGPIVGAIIGLQIFSRILEDDS